MQLGVSKVFLRKPPHDALEAHRVFHQNASATIIQAYVRGIEQHKRFLILASAARLAQRWYRGCVGRAKWWALREAKAGMLLTKVFRMLLLRKKYIAERNGAIKLQAQFRGRMVRKNFAAVTIQTAYRRHVHLTAFIKLRSALITLQNVWRCIAAEQIYQALRAEQKDIGKLKQNNEQLKAEMASLRAMLKAQADGAASKELNQAELHAKEEEIARLEKRVKELEELLKTEKDAVAKLEAELKERPTIEVRNPTLTAQRPISPVPLPPAQEAAAIPLPGSPLPTLVRTVPVDSIELKQHLAAISRLEQELEQEKSAHRLVDAQLVQLKAKMAGIELTESDFEGFLTSEESPPKSVTSEDLDDSPSRKRGLAGLGNTTMKGLKTLSKRISDVNKKTPRCVYLFLWTTYFPDKILTRYRIALILFPLSIFILSIVFPVILFTFYSYRRLLVHRDFILLKKSEINSYPHPIFDEQQNKTSICLCPQQTASPVSSVESSASLLHLTPGWST